jgi:ribosomal protein S18 acetylase RimI-like enzyme
MPDTKYEISTTRRDEFDEIMAMTRRAAVFNEKEVDTVTELLEGYEEGPEISGYSFLSCRIPAHPSTPPLRGSAQDARNAAGFQDAQPGQVVGYACWGPRDLSGNGYDLYWICADPEVHSKGVGRALMNAVEEEIRKLNGVWLVIETSDTDHYAPARRLYERCGYTLAMYLADFYKDGDGLCTYTKRLR